MQGHSYTQVVLEPPSLTNPIAMPKTLILHLVVVVVLFFEIVILVIVVVQFIPRILGCFSEVDGFAACAPAVTDDIVRVDFLHVVFVLLFGFRYNGVNSVLGVCWIGQGKAYALLSTASEER